MLESARLEVEHDKHKDTISKGLIEIKVFDGGLINRNAHLSQSFYLQVATQIRILHGDVLKKKDTLMTPRIL